MQIKISELRQHGLCVADEELKEDELKENAKKKVEKPTFFWSPVNVKQGKKYTIFINEVDGEYRPGFTETGNADTYLTMIPASAFKFCYSSTCADIFSRDWAAAIAECSAIKERNAKYEKCVEKARRFTSERAKQLVCEGGSVCRRGYDSVVVIRIEAGTNFSGTDVPQWYDVMFCAENKQNKDIFGARVDTATAKVESVSFYDSFNKTAAGRCLIPLQRGEIGKASATASYRGVALLDGTVEIIASGSGSGPPSNNRGWVSVKCLSETATLYLETHIDVGHPMRLPLSWSSEGKRFRANPELLEVEEV